MADVSKCYIKWLGALRSDEFIQTNGKLYDGTGFCCLGVVDKVCFDATFHFKNELSPLYADDRGSTGRLPVERSTALNLRNTITSTEMYDAMDLVFFDPSEKPSDYNTREDLLIWLNDHDASFDEIADFIEQHNWHKVPEVVA